MIEARNGAEGLRVWREQGADLVLTDIRMLGINGLEVFLQLRAYAPRLPVKLEDGAYWLTLGAERQETFYCAVPDRA